MSYLSNILNPNLPPNEDRRLVELYRRYPHEFIESFLKIKNKKGDIQNFTLNIGQRILYGTIQKLREAKKPVRIVILKARQLGMCLDPQTHILTADLRWVPIDGIEPGEQLVSVDEYPPEGRGSRRKMRRAVVESCHEVHEDAFSLGLDSGQELIATGQHRFLCRRRGGVDAVWREVQSIRLGDAVRYVARPWVRQTYEDGWYGGLLVGRPWWDDKDLPDEKSGFGWSEVISIKPLGQRRMIDLQTSTKTFIAEGFVSHNSTFTEGLLFTRARLWQNTNCLIVAHETKTSRKIFEMTKFFYDGLPTDLKPMLRYSTNSLIRFENKRDDERSYNPGLMSEIQIATARNVDVGAGMTIHGLHASEIPRWPNPEETFLSMMQTVPDEPDTFAIVESTARGTGDYFHNMWIQAVKERSEWVPVFLPFWIDPQYEETLTPEQEAHVRNTLESDEQELLEQCSLMNLGKVAWRRKIIATKCDHNKIKFNQEYAPTAEACFSAHGETILDLEALEYYRDFTVREGQRGELVQDKLGRVSFIPKSDGRLWVWDRPKPGEDYAIGADGSLGSRMAEQLSEDKQERFAMGADYSAAVVLSAHREQVCEFHDNLIDPVEFADYLMRIGHWYNNALIYPEVGNQGAGYSIVYRLKEANYSRLGKWEKWDAATRKWTTWIGFEQTLKTIPIMMGEIMKEVRRGAGKFVPEPGSPDEKLPLLQIRSRRLVGEMSTYSLLGDGSLGGKHGSNDDLVISLAIGLLGLKQIPLPREQDRLVNMFAGDPIDGGGVILDLTTSGLPGWLTQ